jgi:sulfatase modifying factor 1
MAADQAMLNPPVRPPRADDPRSIVDGSQEIKSSATPTRVVHDGTTERGRDGRDRASSSEVRTSRYEMTDEVFARIAGGWFLMGGNEGPNDERPIHRVWVDTFVLAVHPVTRQQYDAFLKATGHERPRDWSPASTALDLPVVGVSWSDCRAYCAWRAAGGEPVRLPTEANGNGRRGGGVEGARYPWGEVIPAWIPDGGRGPLAGPWPVTLGEPNGFGLMGIAANIHEWCADWYAPDYYAISPERNPAGPPSARAARRAAVPGAMP